MSRTVRPQASDIYMEKYILMPDETEIQHLSEGASAFLIQKRVFAFFCHNRQKKVPARHERIPSKRDIKHKGEKDKTLPRSANTTPPFQVDN